MPISFLSNTDFLDKLKSTFSNSKFWAPALAATIGTGALGGMLAASSNRHKETPRQRRRRILRSILVPSLLTAGAAGIGGLGASALNMEDFRFGDSALAKAEQDIINDSDPTTYTGRITGAAIGGPSTLAIQKKLVGWLSDLNKLHNGKEVITHPEARMRILSNKINSGIDKSVDTAVNTFKKYPAVTSKLEKLRALKKLKGKAAILALPALGAYYGGELGSSVQKSLQGDTYDQFTNLVPRGDVERKAFWDNLF